MTEFNMELVSSASMDRFPENTIANFKNGLPTPIVLEGEWEVGVRAISFPPFFSNVDKGDIRVDRDKQGTTSIGMDRGFYGSVDEIMKEIELKLKEFDELIAENWDLDFDERSPIVDWRIRASGVLTFKVRDKWKIMFASDDLVQMLGVKKNHWYEGRNDSTWPADVLRYHNLYVYTNFIEHGYVGDSKVQLLHHQPLQVKTTNGKAEHNMNMSLSSFPSPIYRKVAINFIQTIETSMRLVTGELVPFQSFGQTNITLHFRKIK